MDGGTVPSGMVGTTPEVKMNRSAPSTETAWAYRAAGAAMCSGRISRIPMALILSYCEAMTITPDAPAETRSIDGVLLTPKEVKIYGQESLMPSANVAEERLRRKQKLAGALRIFGRLGFGEGVAGHITVRDPEFPDHFWVNPLGLSFRHMRVSDLILVNHHGEVVYGEYAVNRAAYVLHAAVHSARPDVIAAAHAHSVYGKAFSSLGIKLDALTQDSCAFYENNVVISDHGGAVVFEEAAGRDFAEAFGQYRAAIHQNHGHFTVGASVDEAVFWFVCFERCAQAQLAAMAAGTPKHIPHESAVYTREQAGNAMTGWAHFQPLWQEICRTDPELFD